MRPWTLAGIFGISVIVAAPSTTDAQRRNGPPQGGPPAAAVAACEGKQADAVCTVQSPIGEIEGVCRVQGEQSFCVPANRAVEGARPGPPGDGAGGGGRPGGGGDRGFDPRGPNLAATPLVNRLTDTGLGTCFDNTGVIDCPGQGAAFFGQDAHYQSRPFAFRDNGDGTVADLNTGLTWQKAHNAERQAYYDADAACAGLALGGQDDWRLPNLKELFSIADFRGSQGRRFFIDGTVFDIEMPGEEILEGDRFAATHSVQMMGQTWSSTIYTGKHWDRENVEAAFFFNYFDGHIKQAPTRGNTMFYRCVRGEVWGVNAYVDGGDGTVTDVATGLMWQQSDDGQARDWPGASAYCETGSFAGHEDWRLPNVKELQSIVDYGRADPALDLSIFAQQDPDGWLWSSTTHGDNIRMAAYVCFGKCISVDGVDVHGAGAQRADPKTGDPSRYTSLGGQADQVRINNYARCVRDAE